MKKLIPILFVVAVLAACQKEPSLSKLDDDYVVFTDYDKSADFGEYLTYYMPDSVLLITNNEKATYWTNEDADLGLQVSYIEDVRYFVDYPNDYWWWGYPGYWGPGYWGSYWNSWYYPDPVVYSYSVNSFLAELVDLTNKNSSNRRLTILWDSYMAGLKSGSPRLNRNLIIQAIDQSFVQSPYLTNK